MSYSIRMQSNACPGGDTSDPMDFLGLRYGTTAIFACCTPNLSYAVWKCHRPLRAPPEDSTCGPISPPLSSPGSSTERQRSNTEAKVRAALSTPFSYQILTIHNIFFRHADLVVHQTMLLDTVTESNKFLRKTLQDRRAYN